MRTFGWKNIQVKHSRYFVWFQRWIVEGYTLRQLASQSGHSISTIRRIIDYWLQHLPNEQKDFSNYQYLLLDGTLFKKRRKGIVVVMDAKQNRLVYGSYGISEGPIDLRRLCLYLKQRGLLPKSATVDGNPHMIKTLQFLWPEIIIQRCLVHIQRQGLSWYGHFPKRTDAKRLRELFLQVMAIHSPTAQDRFLAQVDSWEQTYGVRIATSPESGWVFSDLKRARSMLLAALPNMFHYLDDPSIPTSTNRLEGYFSRLKQKYRQHRGLSKQNRYAYFQWYLHLCQR